MKKHWQTMLLWSAIGFICGFGFMRLVHEVGAESSRSSKWPAIRAAYLKIHPACEACGAHGKSAALEVHHVEPFRDHPELELEPSNLITLCSEGGLDCHLWCGHGGDFKCHNSNVREDAKKIMAAIQAERDRIKKSRKCD